MKDFNYIADFEAMLESRKEEKSESFDINQIQVEQNPYDIFQYQKIVEGFKQEKDEKESKLENQKVNSFLEEDGNDKCNSTTKGQTPISPKSKVSETFSRKRKKPTNSSSKELLKRKRNRKYKV